MSGVVRGPVRVVGVGGRAAGDDAVGLAVLDELARRSLGAGVELHAVADPSDLVPLLEGASRVVIVDAALDPGGAGRVRVLGEASLAGADARPVSSHGVSVAQALALARTLDPGPGPRVELVAIGVETRTRAIELSPEVARAVPVAANAVLSSLGLG